MHVRILGALPFALSVKFTCITLMTRPELRGSFAIATVLQLEFGAHPFFSPTELLGLGIYSRIGMLYKLTTENVQARHVSSSSSISAPLSQPCPALSLVLR